MNEEETVLAIICLILLIPYIILEIAITVRLWFGDDR